MSCVFIMFYRNTEVRNLQGISFGGEWRAWNPTLKPATKLLQGQDFTQSVGFFFLTHSVFCFGLVFFLIIKTWGRSYSQLHFHYILAKINLQAILKLLSAAISSTFITDFCCMCSIWYVSDEQTFFRFLSKMCLFQSLLKHYIASRKMWL